MRPTRRDFVMTAAGAAGLSACTGEVDRPLFATDVQPADYPTVKGIEHIGKVLSERTGGRLSIRTYAGGQLGSEAATLEIAIFGGIDINRVSMSPLNSIAKATIVPGIPFTFRSIAHMRAAMDGNPGKTIREALIPYGLIGLCFYDSGARSFYNTKRPINTPEDMAGLKIRVQNSELFVAMVEALGADATPMNFGEVYQALIQGVIDGAENNWPSYETTRHFEAAQFYTRTEHVMAPEILVMSLKRWNKLSEADQELMLEAAAESVPVMRSLWDARVETSKERILAAGVEVIETVDKAPFQSRMGRVYDRFLTAELRDLFEEIQDVEVSQ